MSRTRVVAVLAAVGLAVTPDGKSLGAPEDVSFSIAESIQLTGNLCRPKGDGPFPALVLMHGCGGARSGAMGCKRWKRCCATRGT